MPTYEYRCPRGHEFEEFQSIKAEPVAKCPKCGRKARRQVSAGAGLIFKGSGFYITDYKKKNGANGASSLTQERAAEKEKKAISGAGSGKKTAKDAASGSVAN